MRPSGRHTFGTEKQLPRTEPCRSFQQVASAARLSLGQKSGWCRQEPCEEEKPQQRARRGGGGEGYLTMKGTSQITFNIRLEYIEFNSLLQKKVAPKAIQQLSLESLCVQKLVGLSFIGTKLKYSWDGSREYSVGFVVGSFVTIDSTKIVVDYSIGVNKGKA